MPLLAGWYSSYLESPASKQNSDAIALLSVVKIVTTSKNWYINK